MKIIKKQDATVYSKPEIGFLSHEYPTGTIDIDCAIVRISGVYPGNNQFVCNTLCTEVLYVLSGIAHFEIYNNNKKLDVCDGDVIVINPNERYRISGNAKFCIVCNPAWSPEQQAFFD